MSSVDVVTVGGSSPRTWGTQVLADGHDDWYWFIPTYMGNACWILLPPVPRSVHPHVHGERSTCRRRPGNGSGSSPRTWGTLDIILGHVDYRRFIPTYMGNAADGRGRTPHPPVHPHVHGERSKLKKVGSTDAGSSPRTWGTRRSGLRRNGILRFIPTYMGNAPTGTASSPQLPVHPHVHGERLVKYGDNPAQIGSSPRTWGTQGAEFETRLSVRFIPTYMGNAPGRRRASGWIPVHPHVHGERSGPGTSAREAHGSSPRTWGTRGRRRRRARRDRFIPTYMGNAQSTMGPTIQRSVHPHVHGERSRRQAARASVDGSSPRTWGTHDKGTAVRIERRFIPTYMGNAAGAF